mgnify:FL=1
MESIILFTVKTYSGEEIPIYGPTSERLLSTKAVNSNVKYGMYIMRERNEKLKHLDTWNIRNKYFNEGNMDNLEKEKKKIVMETNWKLRVLNEQEAARIRKVEAANALLEFAEKAKKEMYNKERNEKAKVTRENNLKNQKEQPLRRSSRLLNNK